ncbi:hypothetical protein E1301_Tti017120 [Triplophysa tibetana]|uniref:Ig-like domain-containing protein n=1 Tax=Triplophysa tibetana TaxID=1572043 RepID=A0A5A9PIU3_9TELE|nr:hypothetical protein E1301_Tti017120 [Triplophysa tibetana]
MATCFTLSVMFLLMTADVDGQQDWGVNYNPSYVCALKGSTVRMSCDLKYPPDYWIKSVHWTKTTRVPAAVSPNLCSDIFQCHTNSITLTHVTEADKGVYYCIYSGYSGEWRGTPGVQLDVTDLQVETQQRLKEGDSVTLTCKTTCTLTEETTFIWYRNGQRLTEGRSTVNLKSVSRHDSGLYRCAIGEYEHLSSAGVYLSVEYVGGQQVWGVKYNPSYVCALRGSTVRMSCDLKYPSDHVVNKAFWTKAVYPGEENPNLCLKPTDRRRDCQIENKDSHSVKKDSHSITLTNVTEADKHVYYCRFTTNHQDGKWTGVPGAQLDVTDLQVETQQRVKEGDSVTLTCKTTCRLTEETTFIWYRNTQTLTEHTVNEFHLQSVSHHDSGVYRCAIRGHEHLSSPGVYLNVEYVDGQQDWGVNYNPSSVCALRGSTVRMSCIYPPDYWITSSYWTKTIHQPVSVSPNLCSDTYYRGKVQCHTNSITLTHVTEADKGVYYCRFTASGYIGERRGTPGVQLDVTDLQVETQQRVKEGDSVTLTCKSTCRLTEETTFIWYRNGQRLTEGRFTVNLQSVSRHDSGLYRCALRGYEHQSSAGVYLSVEYVGGQQDWGVNYYPSYVCALRGSTVRMSCDLKYPSGHVVNNAFWTKAVYPGEENPNLCLKPTDRRRDCQSENKDSHSITLTNVTEAEKHVYYCRFTTNPQDGKWTGIPGAQLDVTDLQVETQQRVKEGDSVTLTCKTTCRLTEETTFIWYRNTQTLTEHTVNEFHLQSVSRHDSGLYRCAIRGHEPFASSDVISVLNTADSSDDTYTALNPASRTSADIYNTIRVNLSNIHSQTLLHSNSHENKIYLFFMFLSQSDQCRAADGVYTTLELQSRSSEYEN